MNSLMGVWLYTSLIYQGQPLLRPNPELKMYFSFTNESQNEIFYNRDGESGYCRRTASYQISSGKLYQKVISVDDNNAIFCDEDLDMQVGRESVTSFEVKNNKLYLQLPLGDEQIIFVWQKQL